MGDKIGIIGHGGEGGRGEYIKVITDMLLTNEFEPVTQPERIKEDKIYDLINRLTNARYEMPIFHKCKSCGFEVVDYQLDENGICRDCRED